MRKTSDATASDGWLSRSWFLGVCLLAVVVRLTALPPDIDGPHAWRQCDTASYTRNFHDAGINLFAPQVHWLGAHKTLLLEFPLPEAIVALVYHVLGESLIIDRLIYLAFFAGAAIYFHGIVRQFHSVFLARAATAVYLLLPLSIFYSRAVHIDFAAMFFAHGFLYHAVRAYRTGRSVHVLLVFMMGALSFLLKAPYAFYLVVPLATLLWWSVVPSRVIAVGVAIGAAAMAFLGWRTLVAANAAAIPDLSFLPNWYSQGDMAWWYYGTLDQRLSYTNWRDLLYYRTVDSSVGWGAAILAGVGAAIFLFQRRYSGEARLFFAAWGAGLVGYLLIFFNLHLEMDYYQIPFIGIWAYLAAVAVDAVASRQRLAGIAICSVVLVSSVLLARAQFFDARPDPLAIARIINRATPQDGLVIAADAGVRLYSSPCTLSESDRFGWAAHPSWITSDRLERFKALGATHLAVATRVQGDDQALHDCAYCGRRLVQQETTGAGSLVSVYDLTTTPADAGGESAGR